MRIKPFALLACVLTLTLMPSGAPGSTLLLVKQPDWQPVVSTATDSFDCAAVTEIPLIECQAFEVYPTSCTVRICVYCEPQERKLSGRAKGSWVERPT